MNDREKFRYDLEGYLVVPGFLTEAEVDALNAAFDANRHRMKEDGNSSTGNSRTLVGTHRRGLFHGMLAWEKPWCDPFRELLCHPRRSRTSTPCSAADGGWITPRSCCAAAPAPRG